MCYIGLFWLNKYRSQGQVMACRLFGAKPLHDAVLTFFYQLGPYEQTLMKFDSKYENSNKRKRIWICRL